jgi:tetratricopeptide (TPR) repeat protein
VRLAIGAGAVSAASACGVGSAEALAEAARLAKRSRESVAFGSLLDGAAAAQQALELAPHDVEVLTAWVHATGMKVLEGAGDEADATAFVYQAWKRGARGATLAFATLAHAVAVGNDRYAKNLLDQHERQGVVADGLLHFVSGAALDLLCSREAEGRFAESRDAWQGAVWPTLRRARALLFHGSPNDAEEDVRACPGLIGDVLRLAGERLSGKASRLAGATLDQVADLPRSLRAIGYTLVADSGTQVPSEIMLADVDSPLAAMLCGDLATRARDLPAAQSALEKACALRGELEPARRKLVGVHLLRGDLEGAKAAADRAIGSEPRSLVDAVEAYERGDAAALRTQLGEDPSDHPWECAEAAIDVAALAGAASPSTRGPADSPKAQAPSPKEREALEGKVDRRMPRLSEQVAAAVPWADVVLLDAARLRRDAATERRVLEGWTDPSPARDRRRSR